MVSRAEEIPDKRFWRERIAGAVRFRDRIALRRNAVRLVFGESDGIPGLVADLYGEHLVVQVLTAGAQRLLDLFLDALSEHRTIASVLARNDPAVRALEAGLPLVVEVRHASWDDPEVLEELAAAGAGIVNVDQPLFPGSLRPAAHVTA